MRHLTLLSLILLSLLCGCERSGNQPVNPPVAGSGSNSAPGAAVDPGTGVKDSGPASDVAPKTPAPGTGNASAANSADRADQLASGAASSSEPMPGSLRILIWNLESGASNPELIATQLAEHRQIDLFVLSEVLPTEFDRFLKAVSGEQGKFASIDGKTGREDSLQVIFNADRLELLDEEQPMTLNERRVNDGRHRSPIVCQFRDRPSGQIFHLVTVHMARGNAEFRTEQSIAIREWARDRLEPVLLAGDLNFDYVFETGKGNEAFEELQRDNVLEWIRPEQLIDSNWFDGNGDGVDDYPGSLLDGAWLSGAGRGWKKKCQVLVREGDFPDNDQTSDHRALLLELGLSPSDP